MPKLAANVSMLFPQLEFLERFAAARAAGFRYVEYQFPYEHPAAEVARAARDAGVEVVLHNLPLGGNPKLERGIAWDDPALAIDWRVPRSEVTLSDKDRALPRLAELGIAFPRRA